MPHGDTSIECYPKRHYCILCQEQISRRDVGQIVVACGGQKPQPNGEGWKIESVRCDVLVENRALDQRSNFRSQQ